MISLPPLYPITDARLEASLADQIQRLGAAGFPLVQFRGKPLDAKSQWQALRAALRTSHDQGGWPLIAVNDRADLALMAAQEGLTPWGLHLGQEDLPPAEARRLVGLEDVHLGTSTHEPSEWMAPDPACDHAGVGPVRGTATKADHATPIGIEGLRKGAAHLRDRGIAAVAIGGLEATDFEACFAAGAASVAMVSALASAADPTELLRQAQVARWRAQAPAQRGQGLVLAGSSGAGKTTLGHALAEQLGLPFVDLDARIEAEQGLSVAALFAHRGEAAFRALEGQSLAGALQSPRVVALGGGAWEVAGVREAVRASGFQAFWLAEHPERCWQRIAQDSSRPLVSTREAFMNRHRHRLRRWAELPMLLPLGQSAIRFAEALASGID